MVIRTLNYGDKSSDKKYSLQSYSLQLQRFNMLKHLQSRSSRQISEIEYGNFRKLLDLKVKLFRAAKQVGGQIVRKKEREKCKKKIIVQTRLESGTIEPESLEIEKESYHNRREQTSEWGRKRERSEKQS